MASFARLGALVMREGRPKLDTALRYAKVELRPPTGAELAEIPKGFQNLAKSFSSGAYRNLTVKQAGLNVLVAMEVACWFFVGEVIGKRHLVGYYIPPN